MYNIIKEHCASENEYLFLCSKYLHMYSTTERERGKKKERERTNCHAYLRSWFDHSFSTEVFHTFSFCVNKYLEENHGRKFLSTKSVYGKSVY